MARIVTHEDLARGPLPPGIHKQAYNLLDCTVTRQIRDVLDPRLDPGQRTIYNFEMACQGPAMSMMLRGLRVDETARLAKIAELADEKKALAVKLDTDLGSLWTATEKETGTCLTPKRKDGKHSWPRSTKKPDTATSDLTEMRCAQCGAPRLRRSPFNPNSDDQTHTLLYTILKLPLERNKSGKVSTDKEVLDRIERKAVKARPFVTAIKSSRQLQKQLSLLSKLTGGRFWYTMNVGAGEMGRWSSSESQYGEGDNAQNITEKLRRVFIADPGRWFFNADLAQADSCTVAHLAGDERYIEAHKTGDVHTYVCRLIWPELPWTGDLAKDKKLASETYPDWDKLNSYRTNCKRNQHGTNFGKTAMGNARDAHIPISAAEEFMARYFGEFTMIRPHQQNVARVIFETGEWTTNLGRRHQFFGRRYGEDGQLNKHTWRQGLAFEPQANTTDILCAALWHIWHEMDPDEIRVLVNGHDAVLGDFEIARALEIGPEPRHVAIRASHERTLERLVALLEMPVAMKDFTGKVRAMTIPVEVAIGDNWSKFHPVKNPGGLK